MPNEILKTFSMRYVFEKLCSTTSEKSAYIGYAAEFSSYLIRSFNMHTTRILCVSVKSRFLANYLYQDTPRRF